MPSTYTCSHTYYEVHPLDVPDNDPLKKDDNSLKKDIRRMTTHLRRTMTRLRRTIIHFRRTMRTVTHLRRMITHLRRTRRTMTLLTPPPQASGLLRGSGRGSDRRCTRGLHGGRERSHRCAGGRLPVRRPQAGGAVRQDAPRPRAQGPHQLLHCREWAWQ